MTSKQLKQRLQTDPHYAIHLAILNNKPAIVNAMMADGLIEDDLPEQALYDQLCALWDRGETETVKYILSQAPYQSGILPEGYDDVIMSQRVEMGPPTEEEWWNQSSNNMGGGNGSSFDWNEGLSVVFGFLGDMFGPQDDTTIVHQYPGNNNQNDNGGKNQLGQESILMIGGMLIIGAVVILVAMKLLK